MKKEVIWPLTVILASAIIGGSLITVQQNKQDSIERQERLKIDREREIEAKAEEAAAEEKRKEVANKIMLDACLSNAYDTAWSFVKLNGTPVPGKKDTYNAPNWVWDEFDNKKKTAEDNCYKRWK